MGRSKKTGRRKKVDRKTLNKKLMNYTLAAGTAMALVAPTAADAAIQYSGIQNIPLDGDHNPVFIDMDDFSGSGASSVADFVFFRTAGSETVVDVVTAMSGAVLKYGGLAYSNSVGYSRGPEDFDKYMVLKVCINCDGGPPVCYGPYIDAPGYIGVLFNIDNNPHFGWIQLQTAATCDGSTTIIDWAYEDVPGEPIHVGSTSGGVVIPTLNEWGLLILAALIMAGGGWSLRRKEEDVGQTPPDAAC